MPAMMPEREPGERTSAQAEEREHGHDDHDQADDIDDGVHG
jgi:hypothetical protein